MTDPAAIDLDAVKELLRGPLHVFPRTYIDDLIAAVEALREQVAESVAFERRARDRCERAEAKVAELEPVAKDHFRLSENCMGWQSKAEAAKAHATELAGALEGHVNGLQDFADRNVSADHEWIVEQIQTLHTALATLPAQALERARATQDIIDIAREIVSTESAWTSEWVAKDRLLHDKFAALDALTPEDGT